MFEMLVRKSPFHLAESFANPYENSIKQLLKIVLERKIHIPHFLSVKAPSVLESFLNRDLQERLGCHPQTGSANIHTQRWLRYSGIALFRPNISEEFGLDNSDPQFTNEPIWLPPGDNDMVRDTDQYEFAGAEYINHLLKDEEESV